MGEDEEGLLSNPQISKEMREVAREKLFLCIHQGGPVDKAQETAIRIEESVFMTTSTKFEYDRMIASRLSHIQQKKLSSGPVNPSSSSSSTSSVTTSSSSGSVASGSVIKNLNDEEKQFVITKLAPLQIHLPKMDKLLLIFQQQQQNLNFSNFSKDLELAEVIRKYSALKGILQKQLELFSADTFIMTPNSAVSLVDHVHKLTALLVGKAKSFVATSPMISSTTQSICRKIELSSLPLEIETQVPSFAYNHDSPLNLLLSIKEELKRVQAEKVKVIEERGDRIIVFLKQNELVVRFFVRPNTELDFRIESGKELLSFCQHQQIIGSPTIRSVWKHLLFHLHQ